MNTGPSAVESLLVRDTAFEPNRGFYSEPIEVTISTLTEGAEIRYTLDGSEPTQADGLVYRGPVPVTDTTTIRAAAFVDGLRPTNVDTHTYIFIETPDGGGVINQPRLPIGFPSTWGTRSSDYEMDSRIATNEASSFFDPRVEEGLLSLPTMSLVMDLDDLFDRRTGIYSNPQQEGVAWERPTSVELIYPDGRRGIQVNAGLRMQGNASRNPNRPKHNMRLLFKQIYGAGKLRYPIFTESHIDEFDTIVLRGGNGDSWFHPNVQQQVRAQYIRDQWHRDTERDMGRLRTHQEYMHLYINGLYWGLYHIFERPNASFLASYLGGEEEDYDSRNARQVVDGDLNAWNELWSISGQGVARPEIYAQIHDYLDVTNLIDFLLINFYSGNVDWDNNNWFGGRRRVPGAQYRFFCWDAERTYWNTGENRTTLNNASRPTGVHQRLRQNLDYRVLFSDRIQKHFFDGGALTPEETDARWMARAREIESALSAEAARWGDNKRPARPYTRDVEWAAELAAMRRNWFPRRTATVLGQLRGQGLYPRVAAPEIEPHGGVGQSGSSAVLSAAAGTVWFTLDGSDPRASGGAVAERAIEGSGQPMRLEQSTRVLARALDGTVWSALVDVVFAVPDAAPLRLTEIMYHPEPPGEESRFAVDDFEFVEIKNIGTETIDLRGMQLAGGIEFDFDLSQILRLEPGEHVVVVENLNGFLERYDGARIAIAGQFLGRLNDGGEEIQLLGRLGEVLHAADFDDAWHLETDGGGHSLVLADESAPWDAPASDTLWVPSREIGGSPGRDDDEEDEVGGEQLPGDLSQDGRVDLSDVVTLARLLFGGLSGRPRCDATPEGAASTQLLLDINGDSAPNISDVISLASYLFTGGATPALGTDCVRLPGCETICVPD